MNKPKTPFEMAKRVAFLMGGNGLTTEQSVLLIAHELGDWQEETKTESRDGLLWQHDFFSMGERYLSSVYAEEVAVRRGFPGAETYIHFLEDMKARGHV